MMTDKWRALLGKLEVTGGEDSNCRVADIELLESELDLTFPLGYKEFCEVFGSGVLGGFINIFCPCRLPNRVDVRKLSFSLDALKEELSWEKERQTEGVPGMGSTKLILLEKLLSNAFVFGNTPNAEIFLWDLSSYSESDRSCDIYRIASDYLEDTFLVGRDFYEFVSSFCLSDKSNEILPTKLHFYEKEKISMRFHRLTGELKL